MHVNPAAGVIAPNTNGEHRTATRVLAIVQLIIGIISFILGVLTIILGIWVITVGQGIWGGIWIGVTGTIGTILSFTNANNGCSCLGGTYMAFSIVSTIIASVDIIILSISLAVTSGCYDTRRYRSSWGCQSARSQVLGVYIPLLILTIIEFFTSIVAAVYSCMSGNCCCCARKRQSGLVITQTQQRYQMAPSQQGQTTIYPPAASYPPASYPPASYPPTTNYQPQHAGYPQHLGVMGTHGHIQGK